MGRRGETRRRQAAPLASIGYHITAAAALLVPEISRALGAALRACYRGGTWFESTAAHHRRLLFPTVVSAPGRHRAQTRSVASSSESHSSLRDPHVVDATRDALAKARSIGAATPGFGTITLLEGYEIGRALELERIAGGWRRVGWKLGFTNQGLWAALGLDQPFQAPVYAETLTPDRIEADRLVQPRIEPEIVLGIVRDVPAGSSRGEIAAAIGWAAAGLEVVQCHFEGWQMSPPEAVADAGLHAALAIGPRLEINAADAVGLSACECVLLCDGRPVASGRGDNVLGGPVEALGWLLRNLPDGLRAGELITTGTLTPAMPVQRGQIWTHRSSGLVSLGTVELSFT